MPVLRNNLSTEDGWQIIETSFDSDQLITTGSNFMIGNGYLGYRGTFAEWEADRFVACTVTDTWDVAPGSDWSELCNVPNGLFAQLIVDGESLSTSTGTTSEYSRELNMRYGLNRRSMIWQATHGRHVRFTEEKFASYANLHLVPMRITFEPLDDTEIVLRCGVDGRIWSLNGEHFTSYTPFQDGHALGIETRTQEWGIQVNVVTGLKLHGVPPVKTEVVTDERHNLWSHTFHLQAGQRITMEQIMVVCHNNAVVDPRTTALSDAATALDLGFDALFAAHQAEWDRIWAISDIQIAGNIEAQTLARFNLYQAIIATPAHGKLPIGARGLSCQVYQGAAFWDQETFNLPMYLYTRPEVARNLLEYRHDTLPGARQKARKHGYYGAFYAWTSGKTGEELFPDYFFTDVLTGRKVHNHFNSWQIHISPDIVYALWLYYEATSDWNFILDFGAEIAFEIAQFLVARVHYKMDKQRYEIIRVLGPDEYHENVDNNAYTNYMAQFALDKAAYIFQRMAAEHPQRLDTLLSQINLDRTVIATWVDIATRIYLPQPNADTLLIEQFDDFFTLENITPDALRQRLLDPGEYWGWPSGIAVEAQVLKQADLLQLFALLDERFSTEVMRANYDYYEPRTEHGSSLSPSVHATVASWVDYSDAAYRYFLEAATIDLYNASKKVMSGGSFLGGIHTAAAGAAWQMIVKGFAGFKLVAGVIHFRPALPKQWEQVTFKIAVRGNWLTVTLAADGLILTAAADNPGVLTVRVGTNESTVAPGTSINL
ncbi:MAG: Trehalose and maltose hydrolase (possible phosphorylase) [Chloroflexi bacterium AL-W]|nr:Trehalose and maltose hydrolase (possible phosphorylase) [Chloroflexi bacterium AL-N1]NOK68121.1 Trehalose and maltose hydrolase (possible phosphorylase) [Chloroflexi bacterium AL-N10]NOK73461.1 Trehalose and maltose hydrolase (possible phosphorylase) [Chloroflexi bacterium AL-N5]NOK83375.1 Trehalose and maltose hydrolase (possible phosphorylase) [Chloroflexi bacterium AL-W]NOK87792.1 Trehalose and maltose hydrolase (possible phosphorylase) [Chloroflexi bacterium AL-N15]